MLVWLCLCLTSAVCSGCSSSAVSNCSWGNISPFVVGAGISGAWGSGSTRGGEAVWEPRHSVSVSVCPCCSLWGLVCPGARNQADWDPGAGTGQTVSEPGCWGDPRCTYVCLCVYLTALICVPLLGQNQHKQKLSKTTQDMFSVSEYSGTNAEGH